MKLSSVGLAMVASVVSANSNERKPTIHWGVNIGQTGTMGDGNGMATRDHFLFVANKDCSLVIMNRTNPGVLDVYKFEDPTFPNNTLVCDAIPLVYSHDGNEFVVYSSRKGHVIAANFDGTAKWNSTVGTGRVENVRIDSKRSAIVAAHNEGSDGRITFLDPVDGSINQDIGQVITNDTITGLSRYAVTSGDVFFASGLTTANLYRLSLGSSFPNDPNVEVEAMIQLGDPSGGNLNRFPPTVTFTNIPIPRQLVPALDNRLYAVLSDYREYDYRKKDESDSSGFASPPLLVEGVGNNPPETNMICWGYTNYNCVGRDTGCPVWSREDILDGISGDPNVWVSSFGQQTILFDDLRRGRLRSLDPITGEDMWVLNCDKDYEGVGYTCGTQTITEGRGAMAVSPDKDLVYFSPAPGWIMAADVFLSPTLPPSTSPTESFSPSLPPSPTSAPSGAPSVSKAPSDSPTNKPVADPTSAALRLILTTLSSAVTMTVLSGIVLLLLS